MLGYLLEPVQLYTCSATHVLANNERVNLTALGKAMCTHLTL